MLTHFLTTAFRFFVKQKIYSFINISGLTVGLASVILIAIWIHDELTFDDFHRHKAVIYQIFENQTYDGGQIYTFAATPGPLAESLKKEFPEVRESARSSWRQKLLFQAEEKNLYETGCYADASLFSIFSFPLVAGDPRNPLPDNSSIAISEKMARKFFGDVSPLGKSFRINGTQDAKVTAVFKDIPNNSSLQFEYAMPFEVFLRQNTWLEDWGNNGIQTFLMLQEGANAKTLASKISGFVKKHHEGSVVDLLMDPMSKWYLYKYDKGIQIDGRILFVRIFAAVALFILIIACINFMNLATARATLRMKEVGIRKISGAARSSIVSQFLGESILTSFLALILAVALAALLMPFFNQLTQKHLSIPFTSPRFIVTLIVITIITGVLAGSYPAFFLSGFHPVQVLKGTKVAGGNFSLRKGLVIFQFLLSIVLIICSLMVGKQVDYVRSKDLGFDRDNIVTFSASRSIIKNDASFRHDLLALPGVVSVGRADTQPFSIGSSTGGIDWDGKPKDATILFQVAQCDYTFFSTVNIKFTAGRNFLPENAADSSNFVVTEEAAKLMNMKEPLGQRLRWDGKQGQIIGVLRDFHAWNLHYGMQPVIFRLRPSDAPETFVKISGANTTASIAGIGTIWKKFEGNFPLEFNFVDQEVEKLYRSEVTIGELTGVFMIMAILISCMGLFALASFTAERRTKEIGIRKVLGASVPGLITSLCRDFLVLVLISIVLGIPLAWYIMNAFLGQYAFHAEMSPVVFIEAAAGLLVLALITVAWQTTSAASINPATSLRNE